MRQITKADWHVRVDQAVRHIMADIDNSIRLNELSAILESSPYHFHRMFKKLTGESVRGCIRRLRLERAGYFLKTTDRKIIDIALD